MSFTGKYCEHCDKIGFDTCKCKKTTIDDLPASEAYERRSVTARRLQQSIERKLRRHAQRNRGKAATWPAVGDLGRVIELLQEANEFLGEE